ncbi:MAG: copper homeostasis protein CutC [Bacteroidaceae bacterium]|nr:copper homeostasis protein CutC [Bacteroidaceae bacterium]
MAILEICAGSIESVLAAQRGGAARVELCAALEIGGTTPSAGLIAQARKIGGITLNVLIRPRGGDFLYNAYETECMIEDIRTCKAIGADSIVIGALTPDGDIDTALCRRLIAEADGMSITFHRAFDMCREPQKALEEIIALGCHRVLTSGQAPTAEEGTELLKQLVAQADGRIIIMPGCGVNSLNAARILQTTNATEIHASARKSVGSNMLFRHGGVSMGNSAYDEYSRSETCEEEVRKIVTSISCL